MSIVSHSVWIIPLIYLVSFLIVITVGKSLKQSEIWVSIPCSFVAFIMSLAVLIERLQSNTLDFSYHLDWLVIGDVYYSVGFEISNVTSWLLLLINTIFFLLHLMMIQKKLQASSILAYMNLLMFALSFFLLSDDLFTLIISSLLVSCSIYVILAHQSSGVQLQALGKYVVSHGLAHLALLVIAIVLNLFMPSHSMQFTMIQTAFSGQWAQFTPYMIDVMSLLVVCFTVSYAGLLPFLNWVKAITFNQISIQLLIVTVCLTIIPTFVLIRFADLLEQSALALHVCTIIGLIIVVRVTFQLLLNKQGAKNYYGLMIIGIMLYTYSYQSYGYMMMMMTLWILALFVAETSLLQKNSLLIQGAFFMAALTLIGIPPLSGYWLHQWIITKLSVHYGGLEYTIGLIMLMLISMNSIIFFLGYWKNRENEYNFSLNVLPIVAIPASMLVFFGLYWMINNENIYQWLFDKDYYYDFRIVPLLSSMAAMSLGAILGWFYSEKFPEKWGRKFSRFENNIQVGITNALNKANKGVRILYDAIVQLEAIVQRIITEWLPYPIRRLSRRSLSASWLYQILFVIGFSLFATLLYWIWRR